MAHGSYGGSVEGLHSVRAALAAGRVLSLKLESNREQEFGGFGIPVEVVPNLEPLTATSAHQGVMAYCRPIPFLAVDELVNQQVPAALLMVDHVGDPHNLGAIARSAVAAGIPRMVVAARRSAPLGPTAFKAAAGALEVMSVAQVTSMADTVVRLRRAGVWTVGLAAGGDVSIFGLELLTEPVALVVGGEGRGLAPLVAKRLDVLARIPMTPGVESLNVSVAAAVACFEMARMRA